MHKSLAIIVAGIIGSQTHAGTNTLAVEMPSVVRVVPVTGFGHCSGAIIGTRPLTVLTAFHCIGEYENGGSILQIPGEEKLLAQNPTHYTSTKVTYAEWIKGHATFSKVTAIFAKIMKISEEFKALEMKALKKDKIASMFKLNLNASADLEAQKKAKASELMMALSTYSKAQSALHNIVLMEAPELGLDLAVLQFENYEGPLNDQSQAQLLEENKIMPLSPNANLRGKSVAFAGYGTKDKTTSVPTGAFTNTVQAQVKNILAVYGMVPNTAKDSNVPEGKMGAILPGDSGGPLFTNEGIVGVASFIKTYPMESSEPLAEGWPQDIDGFYSYFSGRFIDMNSDPAQRILDQAAKDGASIMENDDIDYALTDIHQWAVPESLESNSKEYVFAGLLPSKP